MSTIVSGTVPAEDLVLERTQRRYPGSTFEVEPVVSAGAGTLMPMLRVRDVDGDDIDEALRGDPTVEGITVLGDFGDEWLFRMEWAGMVDLLVQMITNSEATVLDAIGQDGEWNLRVFYPRRSLFSKTHEFCESHGLGFEVESIREVNSEPAGRYDLTTLQYEALVLAEERGYFEVPRRANLQELADELGVSHQSLSECLRRATESLVGRTLVTG